MSVSHFVGFVGVDASFLLQGFVFEVHSPFGLKKIATEPWEESFKVAYEVGFAFGFLFLLFGKELCLSGFSLLFFLNVFWSLSNVSLDEIE